MFWYKRVPKTEEIRSVTVENKKYAVELALSNEQKAHGLSGQVSLAKGTGMLFIFNPDSKPTFHMKNMNFPIDIVWISRDKKVVGVERSAKPWTGLIGSFYPAPSGIAYVLEVNVESGIESGDSVKFN